MSDTVNVSVLGGPNVDVPWTQGMNAQQAIEAAYNALNSSSEFTYALQYYGSNLGYLVMMINETYDSFASSADPFFFWEFLVNGTSSSTGIDSTILNNGDAISFELQMYDPDTHATSTVKGKYEAHLRSAKR